MILRDSLLEFTAIRTITDGGNKTANARLLASLSLEFFSDDYAIEAFERILGVLTVESRIPQWHELVIDPRISQQAREELEANKDIVPLRRDRRVDSLYGKLDYYRKARILWAMAEENQKRLQDDKPDVDALLTTNLDDLLRAQINTRKKDTIVQIGTKDNSSEIFERLMSGKRAEVVRTGFKTFDGRNGGIMLGSLMIVAATTGGGKSAMVTQMLKSMAENGEKVCGVPLEMTDVEMMARITANISGVDVKKFLFTALTKREQRKIRRDYKAYQDRVAEFGGALRIFEPEEDMSIEEILTLLRPYNDKVIIIDYVGLLKGVDGDDQWRQLGKAARYAKIWARKNRRVVILLAQLSDEGAIRYSRAIQEHANNMWSWTYGDKNRETGIIDIQQPKARNQEAFEFQLGHDFSTMRFFDLEDQSEYARAERRSDEGRAKHRKMDKAIAESKADKLGRADRSSRSGRDVKRYLKDRSG